jgi:hypothetical protein
LLGYTTYLFLEYAVTWAFGPMFPLHVGILAISVIGLVALGIQIAAAAEDQPFGERFPRRAYATLTLGMSAMLTLLWSARIANGLAAAVPELAGEATMTVQALDLGLVVPASIVLAVAVLARSRAGILAASAFLVLFVAMAAAIASMMVSAWLVTGESTIVPLATFTLAALAATIVAARAFASQHQAPSDALPRQTPTAGAQESWRAS